MAIANDKSVAINIVNGFRELGLRNVAELRQRSDGLFYFNTTSFRPYELIEYTWNGPMYNSVTQTNSSTNNQSNTKKKGKSGKMAAGALIGTLLCPGLGTVVGAAIGGGGKTKTKTTGTSNSNATQTQTQVEAYTPALLRFRNPSTGQVFAITVNWNSQKDMELRSFNIPDLTKTVADASAEIQDSLQGIKALKELLDMGAITQSEFNEKKKKLLNL